MKLGIHIKNNYGYVIRVIINSCVYYIDDGELKIDSVPSRIDMMIEFVSSMGSENNVKYSFRFHDIGSKDFCQHKKCFNSFSAEYELIIHRDADIYFEVFESLLKNSFSSYDTIAELRVVKTSNIKINKKSEAKISAQNIKSSIIIDCLLLSLRSMIAIIICTMEKNTNEYKKIIFVI